MLTRRAALLAGTALPFIGSSTAQAQQPSTLRIAMTLADIPGNRRRAPTRAPKGSASWATRSTTRWSPGTCRRDAPAKLVPGLATKWYRTGRSHEMDLRVAPGREVPRRAPISTPTR